MDKKLGHRSLLFFVLLQALFFNVFIGSALAWTITVDAGHGGGDPGAIGPSGYKEKDANLDIALMVKEKLASSGNSVIMTRDTDVFVELQGRCDIANAGNSDVFVSIHNNSSTQSTVYGLETYFWKSGDSFSSDSKLLATYIQEETFGLTETVDRGVKGSNFYVLNHTNMPAALVEGAFISNATEEANLQDHDFKDKLAQGVHDGVMKYLSDRGFMYPRLYGANRYQTARVVSEKNFDRAYAAVVATGSNFPDALAGGPFAGKRNIPLLLTTPGDLSSDVRTELSRLGVQKVYLLGGPSVISEGVKGELKSLGYAVDRIYGKDRYETAARIASLDGPPASGKAFLTTGTDFPDALSITPAAVKENMPVLLTQKDALPSSTKGNLISLMIKEVTIIGGTGAVSEKVEAELTAMNIKVNRLAGSNRYETASKIADEFFSRPGSAYMPSGENYPDALAIGPVAGMLSAPVLITQKDKLPDEIADYLRSSGDDIDDLLIIGGTGVVNPSVESSLRSVLSNE